MANDFTVYEVESTDDMDKGIDRLVRKKKFTSLPTQIRELTEKCRRGEFEGDHITHMDAPVVYDVYKLRLPNPDTNVGKSNGYRVVYMVVTEHRIVIFLAIYYKKEDADLPDKYIRTLIDGCMLEFLPEEE